MRIEIIEDDKIVNTIEADEAFAEANYPGAWRVAAEQPEPPITPEDARITRLAFVDRFTDAEAVAIDLASIGATVQAASIRRYLDKVNKAVFIDLSREDTQAGVQALETNGLISVGRADVILTTPIQPHERPQ